MLALQIYEKLLCMQRNYFVILGLIYINLKVNYNNP